MSETGLSTKCTVKHLLSRCVCAFLNIFGRRSTFTKSFTPVKHPQQSSDTSTAVRTDSLQVRATIWRIVQWLPTQTICETFHNQSFHHFPVLRVPASLRVGASVSYGLWVRTRDTDAGATHSSTTICRGQTRTLHVTTHEDICFHAHYLTRGYEASEKGRGGHTYTKTTTKHDILWFSE